MTVMNTLAWGRIALGAGSLLAPRRLGRAFDVDPDPEATYLARVYGARAIAIGSTYLIGSQQERDRWHRVNLAIDTVDTIGGIAQARAGGVPKRAVIGFLLLTGGYAIVGAHQLLRTTVRAS